MDPQDDSNSESSNSSQNSSEALILYERKAKFVEQQMSDATPLAPAAYRANTIATKIKATSSTVPATPFALRMCELAQSDHLTAILDRQKPLSKRRVPQQAPILIDHL